MTIRSMIVVLALIAGFGMTQVATTHAASYDVAETSANTGAGTESTGAGTDTSESAETVRYGFEIALTPAGPARFRFIATVRDLESGDVVAAPAVIFAAGTPARAEAEIPGREHRVMIEAKVSEDLQTAEIVYQTIAQQRSLTFARTIVTLPR